MPMTRSPDADHSGAAVIKPLSLRRNFSWTLFGNVVNAACQWGMLVALAKLTSAESVGQWGFAMAVAAPIFCFFDMRLRLVHVTDVENKNSFGDYFGVRLATMGLAVLMAVGFGMVTAMDAAALSILILVALSKGVDSISDFVLGLLQKRERMDWISQIITVKAVATTVVFGAILYVSQSLLAAILAVVVLRATLLFLLDYRQARRAVCDVAALMPAFHLATGVRIVRQSAPLGLGLLLVSLSAGIPKYFVKAHQGDAALGFFTAMTYVQAMGVIVVMALTEATVARMAREYRDAPRRFTALLAKLLGFGGVLGAVGILFAALFGGPFLRLIYDASYAAHSDVFVWIMVGLAGGEMQAFIGAALIAMRCFRARAVIASVATLACLASAWCLVPRYGMMGGAWSIVVSTWTSFTLGMCCMGVLLSKHNRRAGVEEHSPCAVRGG